MLFVSLVFGCLGTRTPTSPESTPDPTQESGSDPTQTAWRDTEKELQAFRDHYGDRAVLGDLTVDAITAYLNAEDALREGDFDEARQIVDALWAQYPLQDSRWGQAAWTIDGSHVGWPPAYYGLRMQTEILDRNAVVSTVTATPVRMTVVLVGCSEGVQPTSMEELVAGDGEPVRLSFDEDVAENLTDWLDQAIWPFGHYIQAMTDGRMALEVETVSFDALCLPVHFQHEPVRIAGVEDFAPMWAALSEETLAQTDWWWVLYPSAVPEQYPDFETTEFITGGMGLSPRGGPFFISDDRWLRRKPPHMGRGDWWSIERRIYFNQWLQHEFMHHLFRLYPELKLEETSHQWFDRSTWPIDFEGTFEPDYYAEALTKRLRAATPGLNLTLRNAAPPSALFAALSLEEIAGTYARQPVENDWHTGQISIDGENLRWTNDAGVSWSLVPDLNDGRLQTGEDCPYPGNDFSLDAARDPESGAYQSTLTGFWFTGEHYVRQ